MEEKLLLKFIEKKCTREEFIQVSNWINASHKNKVYYQRLQTIWAATEITTAMSHEKVEDKIVADLLKTIHKQKRRQIYKRIVGYTSLAGAVAAIFLLLFYPDSTPITPVIDYESALSSTHRTEDIQLTLNNGETISLSDTSVVLSYSSQGELVINDDTIQTAIPQEPILNTIHVPYGKLSKIYLSDGTKVHLNSGSSFVYPSTFSGNKREVFLDGEAFFEVEKMSNKKFIVQTPYKSVEVLGTSFNVNADKELQLFETVLISGKVSINGEKKKIDMEPNQLYKFSAYLHQEELKTVDTYKYTAWIEGRMYFEEEPLSNVIRKLEKVYNIEIVLNDKSLLSHHISGDLNLKDSPRETIDVVMQLIIPEYFKRDIDLYQLL